MADARAAVFLRQGRAQEALRAHFGHDLAIEALLGIGRHDPRQQLFARIGLGRIGDHPLVLGQAAGQIERVFPLEGFDGFAGIVGHGGHP